jgi:hypothetical protein
MMRRKNDIGGMVDAGRVSGFPPIPSAEPFDNPQRERTNVFLSRISHAHEAQALRPFGAERR